MASLKFYLADEAKTNYYLWKDGALDTIAISDVNINSDVEKNWLGGVPKIYPVYVEQPRNVDSTQTRWTRDVDLKGVFSSMALSYQFIGRGANILRYIKSNNWITGKVYLQIWIQKTSDFGYELMYEGLIVFKGSIDKATQDPTGGYFQCGILSSPLKRDLDAYRNTKYNIPFGHIDSGAYVNDGEWAYLDGIKLPIKYNWLGPSSDTTYGIRNLVSTVELSFAPNAPVNPPVGNDILEPYLKVTPEINLESGFPYSKGEYFFQNILIDASGTPTDIVVDVVMNVSGYLTGWSGVGGSDVSLGVIIQEFDFTDTLQNNYLIGTQSLGSTTPSPTAHVAFSFHINYSALSLPANRVYVLVLKTYDTAGGIAVNPSFDANTTFIFGNTFNLSFTGTTQYPATVTQAFRAADIWTKIVSLMGLKLGNFGNATYGIESGDPPYVGVSKFLNNSAATWDDYWNANPYSSFFTSGNALRNFQTTAQLQANPAGETDLVLTNGAGATASFPLYGPFLSEYAQYSTIQGAFGNYSLQDIIATLSAIWNTAVGMEVDPDTGKECLRLENIEEFFNDSVLIADLGEVSELEIDDFTQYTGNILNVGYNNQSYNEDWGTDEPNLQSTFQMPIPDIMNTVNWVSPTRTDRFGIEFARSRGKLNADTKFEVGNENFLIGLDEDASPVSFPDGNGGTLSATPVKRFTGTEVVKNGLFYPNTTEYNLSYTPKRNMMRHASWLAMMNYKQSGQNIVFQKYAVPVTMGVGVDLGTGGYGVVQEWGDVAVDGLPTPIFLPFLVKFKCPAPINLFSVMNDFTTDGEGYRHYKRNGYFTFTWRGQQAKGFIWEAGQNPFDDSQFSFQLILLADQEDFLRANIG